MIHFDKNNSYYVLLGVGFNLHAFTLNELREQAKEMYNFDISTVLN
jgi:hypothetical protein